VVVSLASKDLSATTAEIMRLFLPTFLLDGSVFLLKIFLALTFARGLMFKSDRRFN